jgi:hypothetical protein
MIACAFFQNTKRKQYNLHESSALTFFFFCCCFKLLVLALYLYKCARLAPRMRSPELGVEMEMEMGISWCWIQTAMHSGDETGLRRTLGVVLAAHSNMDCAVDARNTYPTSRGALNTGDGGAAPA